MQKILLVICAVAIAISTVLGSGVTEVPSLAELPLLRTFYPYTLNLRF